MLSTLLTLALSGEQLFQSGAELLDLFLERAYVFARLLGADDTAQLLATLAGWIAKHLSACLDV
ncbi:MAG: hypothetical protein ACJAQ3_003050, partial [Planctomycetota bacterium]